MQQICTMQGSLAFCEWAITGVGGPYIVQPTVYKSIHKPRIYIYMHLISNGYIVLIQCNQLYVKATKASKFVFFNIFNYIQFINFKKLHSYVDQIK